MTLLITVLAAAVTTIVWYMKDNGNMKLGALCLIYWGASVMWFVDAVAEYIEEPTQYFTPAVQDMLNDTFLGLSAVTLGLVIWLVILLIKDPSGKIRKILSSK